MPLNHRPRRLPIQERLLPLFRTASYMVQRNRTSFLYSMDVMYWAANVRPNILSIIPRYNYFILLPERVRSEGSVMTGTLHTLVGELFSRPDPSIISSRWPPLHNDRNDFKTNCRGTDACASTHLSQIIVLQLALPITHHVEVIALLSDKAVLCVA